MCKEKQSASQNAVVVTVPSTQNTRGGGVGGGTPVLTDVSDVFNNGLKKHVFHVLLASLRLL